MKKKRVIFFLHLIPMVTAMCYFSYLKGEIPLRGVSGEKLPDDSEALYGFVNRTGKLMGKKYDMSLCGVGGGSDDDGIRLINIAFDRCGPPIGEGTARRLVMEMLHEFLREVNSNEALRPYLKVYPFTEKNIDLAIFNHLSNGYDVFFPYIRVISAYKGKIGYFTKEASDSYKYKTEKYESYEEALLILKKQQEKGTAATATDKEPASN